MFRLRISYNMLYTICRENWEEFPENLKKKKKSIERSSARATDLGYYLGAPALGA